MSKDLIFSVIFMKRTFWIILIAVMLVAACSIAAAAIGGNSDDNDAPAVIPAEDVSSDDWFYDAIAYMYDTGLMNGTSDKAFSPYREISRAMPLTVLWRLEGCPAAEDQEHFADVPSEEWFAPAVNWAAEAGIIDDTAYFEPNEPAAREELASMLYAYAEYKGIDIMAGRTDISGYSDASHISRDAYAAMEWICGVNLITGIDEGSLSPDAIANRAQLATMLMRFCRNVLAL